MMRQLCNHLVVALALLCGLFAATESSWQASHGLHIAAPASAFQASPAAARHPRLTVTPARRAIWLKMKGDYERNRSNPQTLGGQLYKKAFDISAGGVTYFNDGLFDAWLAQVPGNSASTYCDRAWTSLGSNITAAALTNRTDGLSLLQRAGFGNAGLGGNFSREHFIDYVHIYDWCYATWAQPRRDQLLAKLNEMAAVTSSPGGSNAWRGADGDQPLGDFFAIAMLYEATKDYNPRIATIWAQPHVGGYVATGANYATARNIIKYYFENAAAGGSWFEGSEYGLGSPRLAIIGNEALKTTDAGTAFPEIDRWVVDHAEFLTYVPTPDGVQQAEYGDDETPRQFVGRLPLEWMAQAMISVGAQPDAPSRRRLQRRILDLRAQHGQAATNPVWPTAYPLVDPYATAAADLSTQPKGFHARGYGLTIWNDAPTPKACQFWAHFKPEGRAIDHMVDYWGDYQLYCNGEFVLTHPIAYSTSVTGNSIAGRSYMADMVNATTIEGLSGFPAAQSQNAIGAIQYRRATVPVFGSDYVYISGTQGGMRHPALDIDGGGHYYDPPPVFVHEHTRSLWYLPTATQALSSIVTIERINAVDPEALPKFDRYRSGAIYPEQSAIKASPRWTTYLHPRANPTIAANVTTWTTAGGQLLRDVWLAPDAVTIVKEDETALAHYDAQAQEKKWRLTVTPNSDEQWNCLMRVTTSRASRTAAPTENELTVTNNGIGVHLVRPGNDDRIVVANCTRGADIAQSFPTAAQAVAALDGVRFRTAGSFSFSYAQTAEIAKVLLADLNPRLEWSYTLDGGASMPITEDSVGFEELAVAGKGNHTIVVSGH